MYASVVHSTLGGIFHTSQLDQGAAATWSKLTNPPRTQGHPYNILVLKDRTLVPPTRGDAPTAVHGFFRLFVSSDGGTTWLDRSDPNMHYWTKDIVIDPNDSAQQTWYVGVFQQFGGVARRTPTVFIEPLIAASTGPASGKAATSNPAPSTPAIQPTCFVTTESDGAVEHEQPHRRDPHVCRGPRLPIAHPMRVFFNPYKAAEVWVASFGGGLRVRTF